MPSPRKPKIIVIDAYSSPEKRIIKTGSSPANWKLKRIKRRVLKKWKKGKNPNILLSHGAHPASIKRYYIKDGMDPEFAHRLAYGKKSNPKNKAVH